MSTTPMFEPKPIHGDTSSATQDMSLQAHLDQLGVEPNMLSWYTKVPEAVIQRAIGGQPISYPHAMTLCNWLRDQYQVERHQAGFEPEHIKGLVVYQLHPKHTRDKKDIDPYQKVRD